jgi:ATP-dependent Lon protease
MDDEDRANRIDGAVVDDDDPAPTPRVPARTEMAVVSDRDEDDPSLMASSVPDRLPVLPLRTDVVFPQTVMPLIVNRPAGIRLIDDVVQGEKTVVLATQRDPDLDEPRKDDFYPTVTVGSILKMLKFPDGTTRVVCQGLFRAKIEKVLKTDPYMVVKIKPIEETIQRGVELDALVHHVRTHFERMVETSQQVPEELQVAAMNTPEPGRLADLLGSSLPFSVDEKQELLAERNVRIRLEKLGVLLTRQLAIMELASKIQAQVGNEITRAQREHFLRQQIKAIREELGENGSDNPEMDDLLKRIEKAEPPAGVMAEAEREMERLAGMHPSSAEYSVIRTYLDWIATLPWNRSSKDRLDLKRAHKILDEDHYDLEKVKERILEYLAVRKLKRDMKGPILCLVGPPGTGKTSLGRSIARALGREFVRISLGGVHDEAEIRGHRRTYVAAMPGRVLQGIRKAGTNNPVFMLDEVDKLGQDFRGDPSSALLEVLDPEQNGTFRDHYLDVEFDLSKVMFIANANVLETIPHPLRDRMEILELPGYSEEEKLRIARRYLLPKQLEAHGLTPRDLEIPDGTITRMIADYTREAGLRNLEREVAAVCRKIARRHAEGRKAPVVLKPSDLASLLGPPRHYREVADRTGIPGVATGLAWTPIGGEILFIEATAMQGKGGLTLTGLLGESMKESAQAAMSYLRSHAESLHLDAAKLSTTDIHIHVPAGAVPKDGPSAGIAISAALLSLLENRPVCPDLAMTGEVTLTGRVLPVGGIREKVLAARRAGIRRVILPRHTENDLEELPREVKQEMTFLGVDSLDDVVPLLFETPTSARGGRKPKTGRAAASRHSASEPERRTRTQP